MSKKTYYVTTPIYYPSDKLHIGHTYTTVAADAIARFKRATGYDVMFLTGTDEHGQKIQSVAQAKGLHPKAYLDPMIEDIKKLWETMEISYDHFIRTTDEDHERRVQQIAQKLYDKGEIYKGHYEGWYCTPCESFWTESQLKEGACPDCGRPVEKTQEEAYFFKLSKYQDRLRDLLAGGKFLLPESRANEMIKNFIDPGLEDLCITRTSFDWGIPAPFDEKHIIYVWLDALSNYITALGYPDAPENYNRYWPADVHLVGKEIVRFHTIIWPAMLMALEEPLPKTVFGHGWLLLEGGKMSKSKGNVVDPVVLIERYGVDALKYFLLREYSFGNDGNFNNEVLLNRINSDLANDLGNLVSRSIAMILKYNGGILPAAGTETDFDASLKETATAAGGLVEESMNRLDFSNALEAIWKVVRRTNKYIDETAPWILAKDEAKRKSLDSVLYNLAESIRIISVMIQPFMPHTAAKIWDQLHLEEGELTLWDTCLSFGLMPAGVKVRKADPLFPRIDVEKELENLTADSGDAEEVPRETEPIKPEITLDDFAKVDLRVAEILKAEKHPDADKLLVLQLKIGKDRRQIVSGIAGDFTCEELVGKKIVVIVNLKPVKLRGVESNGMLLAAEDIRGLSLLTADIADGSLVR